MSLRPHKRAYSLMETLLSCAIGGGLIIMSFEGFAQLSKLGVTALCKYDCARYARHALLQMHRDARSASPRSSLKMNLSTSSSREIMSAQVVSAFGAGGLPGESRTVTYYYHEDKKGGILKRQIYSFVQTFNMLLIGGKLSSSPESTVDLVRGVVGIKIDVNEPVGCYNIKIEVAGRGGIKGVYCGMIPYGEEIKSEPGAPLDVP